jgi:predicted hotdog family 3-hydroxylacyl-ACP dehydratase
MGFPALDELLFLTPPMLWLDEIVAHDGSSLRCRLVPREAHPFVEAGSVEPLVAVEWMGQAAAALAALLAREAGDVACPRLVAEINEAQLPCAPFVSGQELWIDARLERDDAFRCSVSHANKELAWARIRLREHKAGAAAPAG